MDLTTKNIDITKADLGLRHIYVPQTPFNLGLEEKDRIAVDLEYFQVGERIQFTLMDEDGMKGVDFRRVFKDKVKSIKNLNINGNPVKTAKAFLLFPAIPELEAIMMDVVLHIIKADSLNEDERKN